MNDGTINAVTPVSSQGNNTGLNLVTIESLPPNVPTNTVISGQVIAKDNNQTNIQTDQGVVVLQAALDVAVGQKINLRIETLPPPANAQPNQQITQNFVAQLLNVSSDKIGKTADIPVQTNSVTSQQPLPPTTKPIDPVVVHEATAYEEYKPLQALIVQMPENLSDETLDVMVKSLLKLPMQQPVPPSIQEGFAKLDQLVSLLSQANLFPANSVLSNEAKPGLQQNIVSMLQQLLQPSANTASNPLLSQPPHQFIQLQTIQPGENLSPNILVNIKEQLTNLLQAQPPALQATPEKVSSALPSFMPQALSALLEKASSAIQSGLSGMPAASFTVPPMTETVAAKPQTLFTLPAIGLVLGLPPTEIPQLDQANLVLMTTPSKSDAGNSAQHLIALLGPQTDIAAETPHVALLPGSVIVAALKPQAEQTTSFAVLPKELMPITLSNFASIHPSLGENWPALDDLWQQLTTQTGNQPVLQTPLQQLIPTPSPQQFPPAMLFFLSVLKNGFTSDWVTEKHLAGLENIDKAALIKTLAQDMRAIKGRMEEAGSFDAWRPLPVPVQVGDQLMRLQWFYRHPEDSYQRGSGEQEENTPKKRKTRFLLNVPKTMVGDLQIDGLVQEKNLDIILRSENMLASNMETAIRGRYAAVLETTGMVGGISFQSGRDHYVHV